MSENINQYDENCEQHGYWDYEFIYDNDILGFKGNFIHGKKIGYWEILSDYYYKGNYNNDIPQGIWKRFDINGVFLGIDYYL